MSHVWVNLALLPLLIILLASGFWGLIGGTQAGRLAMALHGIGGYVLVILLAWKGRGIINAFRQGRRSLGSPASLGFLTMAGLLLAILLTGLSWSHLGPSRLLGLSTINLHAFLGLVLMVLLAWHVLVRRFVFGLPEARGRRPLLRATGAGLAGLGLWLLVRPVQAALNLPGVARRFTGSYEVGSHGGHFPSTSWLFDNPPPIQPEMWQLVVDGVVQRPVQLTYSQVVERASEPTMALLDCTGGWYTTQQWQGISLAHLLGEVGVMAGARSVAIVSATGYRRRFSLGEARGFLLATHVAQEVLSHGHGFPLRLVAPGRRGLEWVKWVVRIEVDETSPLWQPPLPL